MSNVFENRIIGYGTKPADQFTPNDLDKPGLNGDCAFLGFLVTGDAKADEVR